MTHKLLLADDSVTIQRVVELTFSGEDVQVVTADDGEQAIARIPIERPDVVLADIGMPNRSGYDVAAFVKGRPDLAHIPVLLLAGAFEPVDEARVRQVGSDGVLVKPFEPQQLISRVKDLIDAARNGGARPRPTESPAPDTRAPSGDGSENRIADPDLIRLDDYFERLDAAFAQLGSDTDRHLAIPSPDEDDDRSELPTLESLLGPSIRMGVGPGVGRASVAAADPVPPPPVDREITSSSPPMEGRNLIAEMFAALFAAEESAAGAPAVQIQGPRPETAVVTDGLVDEVTRRVIARLAPGAADDLVTRIVSDVAERLVREEIARIKTGVAARL